MTVDELKPHCVRKLMLTGDDEYVQEFFWVLPSREDALERAHQLLDDDTTGLLAVNVAPAQATEQDDYHVKH